MAKYKKWVEKENLIILEGWAREGLIDEEIAGKIGITAKTLYVWKNKYSDICEALKRGKEVIDFKVEQSLLKKALGYTTKLAKTFKVKRIDYDPKTGKKIREYEELVIGYDDMHVPPDTTADIFWLKNRKPDKWRDKHEIKHSGDVGNPFAGLTTADLKKLIKNGG